MKDVISALTITLCVALSFECIAGDIKPLYSINGSLGASPAGFPGIDKLKGVCPLGTIPAVFKVSANVRDLPPVSIPYLHVKVHRLASNSCAAAIAASGLLQTDPNSNSSAGDGNLVPSPNSNVPTANGNAFLIEVSKTSTGASSAENYRLDYWCENGTFNVPLQPLIYCQNQ